MRSAMGPRHISVDDKRVLVLDHISGHPDARRATLFEIQYHKVTCLAAFLALASGRGTKDLALSPRDRDRLLTRQPITVDWTGGQPVTSCWHSKRSLSTGQEVVP